MKHFGRIYIDRQLDGLLGIGLVERTVPVTEDSRRTKRAVDRTADNFLAFAAQLSAKRVAGSSSSSPPVYA